MPAKLDLDELQKVHDAATPGVWEEIPFHVTKDGPSVRTQDKIFIATFDPVMVGQMLARLRESQEGIDEYEALTNINIKKIFEQSTRIAELEGKIAEFIDGEDDPIKYDRTKL